MSLRVSIAANISQCDLLNKKKNREKSVYSLQRKQISQIPIAYLNYGNKEKMLENSGFAFEYFENNYKNKKPLFGTIEDFKLVEKNTQIKRNLCKFLVNKSAEELELLKNTNFLTNEKLEKIDGYTQIHQFFSEYLKLLPIEKNNDVIFSGEITSNIEQDCKNMVHAYASACSLISAGAGFYNVGSSDAMALRTLQGMMFTKLANKLEVPMFASMEYMAKELYTGAVIGGEGAKILTDIVGGIAHGASALTGSTILTGGGSHVGISTVTSAIHGSLSFLITEKMGRGYIKQAKSGMMTNHYQTVELAKFLGVRCIFGGFEFFDIDDVSVDDAFDAQNIKKAYEAIPNENKAIMATLVDLLKDYNATKLGYSFLFNFAGEYISTVKKLKNVTQEDLKKIAENSFREAFIYTAIYDMFELGTGQVITQNAKNAIIDIKQNYEEYPEVFKVFKNAEYEFFEKLDLNKLNTKDFQEKFTNKDFLINIGIIANSSIKDFEKACRSRKNSVFTKELNNIMEAKRAISNDIRKKSFEAKDREIINNIINSMITNAQSGDVEVDKFAFGRILGYDAIKQRLINEFGIACELEKADSDIYPPSGILFYGPTNTGKTTLAQAFSEQIKASPQSLRVFLSDEKIVEFLEKNIVKAKERFETKKQRTIILVDEAEGLVNKPLASAKLQEILSDEDSRISVFFTTNEPQKVDKSLLKGLILMYVGPADDASLKKLFVNSLKPEILENIDVDLVLKVLNSNKNGKFSNAQIIKFAKDLNRVNLKDTAKILKYLALQTPEISLQDIEQYERGQNAIR